MDTKQDAWFIASSFDVVFETLDKKPTWYNSELMAIVGYWHEWYDIKVESWLFLEPGEAKTIVDSHHAAIAHSIKWYLRIGYNIETGDDICEVVKDLSGTFIANIEPNRDDNIIMEENIIEDDNEEGMNVSINNNPVVIIAIPRNKRNEDKMNAQTMYNKLLKYIESEPITPAHNEYSNKALETRPKIVFTLKAMMKPIPEFKKEAIIINEIVEFMKCPYSCGFI
ncbi:hypothetical protein C2G38_2197809 [Gigaspora rosea]|uniref:Uncharacterized protein n=1 Tax=Gigaspora rosea TaxID=44941 RepID=A0A397UTA7_9GLOM|nr:hypothetical protein C2G38_2197809 [Gigaspora rosea]